MVLNIALVGAAVYAGVELRRQWAAAKEREAETIRHNVPVTKAPPFPKAPEVPPVMASAYEPIASNYLLDPSRNSEIVKDPPPAPPPPPQRPPLPLFHGMMDIGDGPEIILSEDAKTEHKRLHSGDKIGQFTLVAFNSENIELEWNGERIIKALAEIAGHGAGPRQAVEASHAEVAATAAPKPQPSPLGPGPEGSGGTRGCLPNDSTPVGAVVGDVKKTLVVNALTGSQNCIWVPVTR